MNKSDLVNRVVNEVSISKLQANNVVEAIVDEMKKALANDEHVTISGFGSFRVKDRKERIAYQPKTHIKLDIPAKKIVKFKASKMLFNRINQIQP